jgi:HEAT repeat protein
MLTPTEARTALATLVKAAQSEIPASWIDGAQWLEACDGRTWLLLDDMARNYGPSDAYGVPVSGTRGWLGPNVDEPSGFVAAITSLHADGRIRQRATRVLAQRTGRLAAAALALRALDHVPQVREDAQAGLLVQATLPSAEAALAVLISGAARVHGASILQVFVGAVESGERQAQLLAQLMESQDRSLRRWAFARAQHHGLLPADRLAVVAKTEQDQLLRAEAVRWLGAVATPEQLQHLLQGRFVDGRVLALTTLSDPDLATEVVVSLLDDSSARVRSVAQWRARRRGVDPTSTYRARLRQGEGPPARLAASIDGLSSLGTHEDVELIQAYLADANIRVRAAAASGLALLAEPSQARELLVPLLVDGSPRVSAAAARGLARVGGTCADAAEALTSEQPWSRRAGWRLCRSVGGWQRVVADVNAAADTDPLLAGLGLAGLRNWLDAAAATTWGQPTEAQRTHISQQLPQTGLNSRERRMLAFHAGMDQPATVQTTTPANLDGPTTRGIFRLLRRPR